MSTHRSFGFGPFCLVPAEGLLLKGDKRVRLGSRALDMLTALVERDGELVSKDELMARVWPDTFVGEGSLRVSMVALRKALDGDVSGDRYVGNVPGRGYRFLAPVLRTAEQGSSKVLTDSGDESSGLPARIPRLIGRDVAVATIAKLVSDKRFVTIAGTGGIGNTTVAIAVSHALAPSFGPEIRFLQFSSLSNPELLASMLASSFGLQVDSGDALPYLIGYLRERHMLLVLDCCEHLIDGVAAIAQRLYREAPDVHLLATSREPLRVEGEHVFRLPPLETPPAKANISLQEVLTFPVVQLFMERASASLSEFTLTDAKASTVAAICRHLDGIPLAIELAAARTGVFDVTTIAAALNNLFWLLTDGRRTALPRHQTLRATLDWSHALLPEREQIILRRLAIFRGSFRLEAGVALAADISLPTHEVWEGIGNLTAKSLLTADFKHEFAQYRLLDTTRAYASEKLSASGEAVGMAHRHAALCLSIFEPAEHDWETKSKDKWLEIYAGRVACLRAALDWAFSPAGDVALGIALTAASAPLWPALSLIGEYCDRLEKALQCIPQASLSGSDLEMKLNLALGAATFNARGSPLRMAEAPARALEIAEQRGETTYGLSALFQMARERAIHGDNRRVLELGERADRSADASEEEDVLFVRDRMMGLGLHLMGRHTDSRPYIERAFNRPSSRVSDANKSFNEWDAPVAIRSHLARIVWVQGYPDRAAALAAEGVDQALEGGYSPPACHILAYAACPIAFWTGNVAAIRRYVRLLAAQAADFPVGVWQTWHRLYEQVAAFADSDDAPPDFKPHWRLIPEGVEGAFLADLIGTFRPELVGDRALARAIAGDSPWCAPEIFRGQGVMILRREGAKRAEHAEALFEQALALAQQQGALSWELRAAVCLVRLWKEQGRGKDGHPLLASVYERFDEGFQTADLIAAKRLLDETANDAVGTRKR